MTGIIIKGVGGRYIVKCENKINECSAKGVFRKKGITPLVGDYVEIENDTLITKVLDRKNSLIRPPVANIDKLIIVCASADPEPNFYFIDKLTAIAVSQGITPIIVINKHDIKNPEEIISIYRNSGIKIISCSAKNSDGIDELKKIISSGISVFTGASGVGKSSIINCIFGDALMETGDISDKIKRGKHTTRHAELFVYKDGFVADTPGFSSVDIVKYNVLDKKKLQYYFPEFLDYIECCRFSGCAHIKEKDCEILNQVEKGNISKSRFQSYQSLYNELKDIKEWQIK
ncbi:MAG: ribosome small subunit-dependent GTPase A [Clostridia bacterium]|nr:ribosome small subunit-dependent GTPase A [Clostridia bacterium]